MRSYPRCHQHYCATVLSRTGLRHPTESPRAGTWLHLGAKGGAALAVGWQTLGTWGGVPALLLNVPSGLDVQESTWR